MTTIEKPKFLFTFVTNNKGTMSANSPIYNSFNEAIDKLNKEADRLSIYSGTVMTKKIGTSRLRANTVIKSEHIDAVLQVAPLTNQDDGSISTYGLDYDHNGDVLI